MGTGGGDLYPGSMGPGQIAPYLRDVKKRNVIRIPGRIIEAGRNTR